MTVQRQVCIVGAGTAGIFLANLLRKKGCSVLLLEAGDESPRSPEAFGLTCHQSSIPYRGANAGRSIGLGGTSVLWGGQLIPLTASDMAARPALGIEAWPVTFADLGVHVRAVRQLLGLEQGDGDGPDRDEEGLARRRFALLSRLDPELRLRLSHWLPFSIRNFAKAFAAPLRDEPEVEVWLNAPVVGLHQAPDSGRLLAVEARGPGGQRLLVEPEAVVICAGALESTRLLLEFDEAYSGRLSDAGAPLGHYFSDHLSVICGRFECNDWRRYNLATAPVFDRGLMRTPRLELTSEAQQRLGLTSAFAHFTFTTNGDTGFDVLRNLLRRRQGEQQGLGLSPGRLWRFVHDVSLMAFWRGIHRRLWIPRLADLLLQVDIEQKPNWNSRLSLTDERDGAGRKRLRIAWQIQPDDIRVIQTMAELTRQAWESSELRKLARLRLTLPEAFDTFESLYDVYHPTGTLRMGSGPANSVVDSNLRVWGLENCYVSSTAVFPSAGSANPGLMHLALTARLADHLRHCLKP